MAARKNTSSSSLRRKKLALVQFTALPSNVFFIAKLPLGESACERHIVKFAERNRISADYNIAASVVSATDVLDEVIQTIRTRWQPFAYGSAGDLFEGSVRKFRNIWNSVMTEHPAALLLELADREKRLIERLERIDALEIEIAELRAELDTRMTLESKLKQMEEQLNSANANIDNLRYELWKKCEDDENFELQYRIPNDPII